MIDIINLSKQYGSLKVLDNISLSISKGSIYGLVGASGVGKSTLLRCINGLERFDKGDLLIDGLSLKNLSDYESRQIKKNTGMIFQNFSLLQRLNVYDNIALPMTCWKYDKQTITQRVSKLLDLVQLSDKAQAFPRELSGGQKQRVAIARALSMKPKILLCDEPTSALDPQTAKSVIKLIVDLTEELNITTVLVTHQMEVAKSCCDEIAILEGGRVAVHGDIEKIFWEEPEALKNLVGEEEFPEFKDRFVIDLLNNNPSHFSLQFKELLNKADIPLEVLGGKINRFRNRTSSTLQISVYENKADEVMDFFKNNNIPAKIVRGGKNG